MELPGDCCRGVPFALMPFTTLMFGPIMLPESEFNPLFTDEPVCAAAAKGKRQMMLKTRSRCMIIPLRYSPLHIR